MSRLVFIRHAQASYGAANYDQLSDHGIFQSGELAAYLVRKGIRFDKWITGPLERQKHTAQIVMDRYKEETNQSAASVIIEDLKEHHGTEGIQLALPQLVETVPQIREWQAELSANPSLRKRNGMLCFRYFMTEWTAGNIVVDGIESWASFRAQVKRGLEQVQQLTGKGETVAIFTSGGTISAIIAEALAIENETKVGDLNFSIRNTSLNTFLYSKGDFNVLAINEVHHLADEHITFV